MSPTSKTVIPIPAQSPPDAARTWPRLTSDMLRCKVAFLVFALYLAFPVGCRKSTNSLIPSDQAQHDDKPRRRAKPTFQVQHDFGVLQPNEKTSQVLLVPNGSQYRKTIKHISRSCNCLATNVTDKVIEPGGAVQVCVEYTAPPRKTDDRRSLEVVFVEDEDHPLQIVLTAKVREVLSTDREEVVFSGVARGTKSATYLRVDSYDSIDWEAIEVNAEDEWLSVATRSLDPFALSERPHQAWELAVNADTRGLSLGEHRSTLTINVDGKLEKSVPVLLVITGPASAVPSKLFLGKVAVGRNAPVEVERTFLIRFAKAPGPPSIDGLRVNCRPPGHISASPVSVQDDCWRFKAIVTLSQPADGPEARGDSTFNGEICLEFGDPAYPNVVIPVRGGPTPALL